MADGTSYRPIKAEVFKTSDGAELVGQLYAPSGTPRGALVLNGATGVAQKYYRAFAEYAAQEYDLVVFTYDYRDMGRSVSGPIRKSRASMADWGLRDQEAARKRMRRSYPDLPLWVIGHSLGGMTLPLQDNTSDIDRVICVASGNVHHKDHPWPYRAQALMFWFGLGPLLTGLFGYLPGRLMGLGADIPAPAYWQWRRWCTSRSTFADEAGKTLPVLKWEAQDTEVKFVAFADDDLIPAHCVARLAKDYGKDASAVTVISPADLGLKKIGHIGAFARANRAVWDHLLA
ncbi:MAG: putative alpha/beta hydrolase [Sulfitobacter sp.]|jgi:predicted alpha/beta hydrolase